MLAYPHTIYENPNILMKDVGDVYNLQTMLKGKFRIQQKRF